MKETLEQAMARAAGFKLADPPAGDNEPIIDNTDDTAGQGGDNGDAGAGDGDNSGAGQNDTGSTGAAGSDDGSQSDPNKKVLPGQQPVVNDFDKLLAERSNGKFKAWDDIEKALNEAPKGDFANEEIAKLNDFVRQGGDINDFVRTQRADYSKMADADVLRNYEKLIDPTLSDADIDLLVSDKYGVAENATDQQKRLAEIRMKRDASEARKKLIDEQGKWKTSLPDPEAAVKQAQKWITELSSTADKVEKLEVRVDETSTFSYTVPVDVRNKVKEANKDLSKFFNRYINADGSENIQKFVQDMIILENFNQIVAAAAAAQKNKGKENVIKDLKNTNFTPGQKGGSGTSPKSIAQQAAEQIFGR